MNRIIISMLCLLFCGVAVRGQNSNWQEIPRLYGGVYSLAKTNSGQLYAIHSNGRQVYRSDNGGNNWQYVYGMDFGNYTFYIGSTGSFYVRNGSDWYRSTDEGLNWNQMGNASNQVSKFVETPAGVLVGYNYGYFLISQDGGTTWMQTSDFPLADDLEVDRLDITPFGGLLASTYTSNTDTIKTLYRSTDEGQSWQRLQVPAPSSTLFIAPSGTMFLSTASGGLHRSIDMGQTFDPVAGGPNAGGNYMMALSSGRILAIALGVLFFSDDDGVSWQTTNVQLGSWWGIQQITPLSDGSIFSDALYSLYKSSDGGQNWYFAAVGMRQGDVQQMRFISDSVYYAGSASGIWKTSDGGQNWDLLTANKTIQNAGSFELTSSGSLVAVQDNRLLLAATGDVPFDDITPPDSLLYAINRVMVNPFNDHIFISTKKGFARSADQGQSWQTVLDSAFVYYAAFHPSGRILAIANSEQIIISDDGGLSWDTAAIPPVTGLGNIKAAPNGNIYVIAVIDNNQAQLLKSEDAGASWNLLEGDIGIVHFWTTGMFDLAANGHLFRGDQDKNLFLSASEGLSWQSFPEPDPEAGSFFTLSLFISPGQYLYVHTIEGSFKTINPVTQGAFIRGTVRRDADADCSTPDAQASLKNWIVEAAGDFDYFTQTNAAGSYTFFVDTGAYQVSVTSPNLIWWNVCENAQIAFADSLFSSDTIGFAASPLAGCPLMTVDVAIPILRRCFDNTVFVQYCNQGSEPADSAWVDVFLDPNVSFVNSAQPHNSLANNVFRFFLGDVESGECGQFSLIAHVNCDSTVLGQTHCITVHAYPDTFCTPVPNWSGATIEAEVECQDTSVQFHLRNTGNAVSHILDYIIIEDDVVLMQGEDFYAPGEEKTIQRTANGHTWRIESQQEPGHPFSNIAVAFAEGCGGFESLGFINQFNVNTFQPSWDRTCVENTGAYDPNDKQGFPLGYGTEHRIRPGQELEYMIRFQNTGTDSAFNIVIRDTFSLWLDPASVRPGAASHPYTWELSGQGVLSFTFSNILLPDSNTNLLASQGFVSFKINQGPDVPLETQIFNSAAIYFDFNAPVITNQTLHTVGEEYLVGTYVPKDSGKRMQVTVSPNPVAESAVFQIKEGIFDQHRFIVTDTYGQKVRESEVSGKQYLFQRKGLPPGAYFFRLEDAAGRWIESGTIILR